MKKPRAKVSGTIEIELRVSGTWAVSELTRAWAPEEQEKLASGDQEALEALKDEAASRTLDKPDDCDIDHAEIQLVTPEGKESDG